MATDDQSRIPPAAPANAPATSAVPPASIAQAAPGHTGKLVRPGKLWFGLAAAAIAWVGLGIIDILIAWVACSHENLAGGSISHAEARLISFILSLVLLATAVIAGSMSYRNWRSLSSQPHFLNDNVTEPHQFVAMLGVIISITLGMGIVWLALAPIFITSCQRAK